MNYMEIVNALVKIILTIVSVLAVTLLPVLKAWMQEKVGAQKLERVEKYVSNYVGAAEQLLKEDDPDGSKRKAYVCNQLISIGYQITDTVNSIIEAKVYSLK